MKLDTFIEKLKTIFWMTVIVITVFMAVTLSTLRFIMPHLAAYIPEVESVLSRQFNAQVTVAGLDSGWQGFGPAIRLEEVSIYQPETDLLLAKVDHLDVQLNVWASLIQRRWVPGRLTLDGLLLTLVKTEEGTIKVQGFDNVISEQNFNLLDLVKRFHRVDIKEGSFTLDLHEGDPIDLELVYFTLSPNGLNYRLELDLRRQNNPEKLTVIADLKGGISNPNSLTVDGYIQLENIGYDARYMNWELKNVTPKRGRLNLNTWFKWKNGTWEEVIGDADIKNLLLSNGLKQLPIDFIADIAWKRKGDGWELKSDGIELKVDEVLSPLQEFVITSDETKAWDVKLNAISIDNVFKLLDLSDQLSEELETWVEYTEPSGRVTDVQIIATPDNGKLFDWQVGFKIENWRQNAYKKYPGITNLAGELRLTQNYGQFTLNSKDVLFNVPEIFEHPVDVKSVNGLITWHNDGTLTINAADMHFSTDAFMIETDFEAVVPDDPEQTQLKLSATTENFGTDAALRYLPSKILPVGLITWLHSSIERGHITHMEALFEGPIMQFPFREDQGVFELKISVNEVDLAYHKDWPLLQSLSGEVVIDTKTVQAYVDTGYFYHSAITQAKVLIELMGKGEPVNLFVSGSAEGPASDMVNFLQRSPLWKKFQSTFDEFDLNGSLNLDLDLNIPLNRGEKKFGVKGLATLKEGEIHLKNQDLAFSNIHGSINFTEAMLSASDIQGTFLDNPARLEITPTKTDEGYQMRWALTSQFTPQILNEHFPNQFWNFFVGETTYTAEFTTYIPKRDVPLELTVSSNLVGMEIDTPLPIGKTKEETVDARVTFTPTNEYGNPIRLVYGKLINAVINLKRQETAWDVDIDSKELLGNIHIPDDRKKYPLRFDLQRCALPAIRSGGSSMSNPKEVTAVDFTCQDMSIGDQQMGFVHVVTKPVDQGVEFNPITISNPIGKVEAKGSWLRENNLDVSKFSGTAETSDLSYTLSNLNISTDVRDAKGNLQFDLNWPGTPMGINKQKLSGQVTAHLSNGRIVEVNPGFGRVLGLLSMQGLQRRMRLDFSDVFKEGFSFDSFDGTATIANGTIYTKDAKLKAPSANIDISGQAGLASQQLDFNLYVKANIDPTIPAAAVALANPIAGAAVWVAGKMVNPLGNKAYYHYHVTGTWSEPVFTDLSETYRKKLEESPPAEEAKPASEPAPATHTNVLP